MPNTKGFITSNKISKIYFYKIPKPYVYTSFSLNLKFTKPTVLNKEIEQFT